MKKYLFGALALALVLVSCGKKAEEEIAVELQGISLNKKSLSMEIGDKATLIVLYTPEAAEKFAPAVTWESSSPGVATVQDGKVTAKKKGKTTISAYCGKFYADCEVEVETGGSGGGGGGGEDTQKFEISPTTIDDSGTGGTYTITVTSNRAWTAECEKPWATISPDKGDGNATVTVTVEANTEETADAQTITFTSLAMKKTVTINRPAYHKIVPITLDTKEKELPVTGGSFEVKVTSEADWNVKCQNERVHITKNSSGVSVEVDVDKSEFNYTPYRSKIPVVFSNADVTDTLFIKQEAPYVSLSPSDFFTTYGLEYTCQLKSNISWSIAFEYESGANRAKDYMIANPKSGTGDASVKMTITKVHSGIEWLSGSGYVWINGTGDWAGLKALRGHLDYRSSDF